MHVLVDYVGGLGSKPFTFVYRQLSFRCGFLSVHYFGCFV